MSRRRPPSTWHCGIAAEDQARMSHSKGYSWALQAYVSYSCPVFSQDRWGPLTLNPLAEIADQAAPRKDHRRRKAAPRRSRQDHRRRKEKARGDGGKDEEIGAGHGPGAGPSPPRDDSPSIDSTFDSSSDEAYQSSDDEDYADSGSDNDKDNDYEPFPSTATFSTSTITTTTATKRKAPRKCHRSPPTDMTLSSSMSNIVPIVSDWTRTSDGRYECPQHDCDKTFVRKFNGMTHYATHFGVRQFACRHCPRTFTRSYDLKRHCKLHQMGKQGTEDSPIVVRKSRGPLKPRSPGFPRHTGRW
ncbi:Metallothionein expression activator [Thoreauomyces humboldtii]|nr:Metallothionein expression activator [Thoreauomyces humboldtii]